MRPRPRRLPARGDGRSPPAPTSSPRSRCGAACRTRRCRLAGSRGCKSRDKSCAAPLEGAASRCREGSGEESPPSPPRNSSRPQCGGAPGPRGKPGLTIEEPVRRPSVLGMYFVGLRGKLKGKGCVNILVGETIKMTTQRMPSCSHGEPCFLRRVPDRARAPFVCCVCQLSYQTSGSGRLLALSHRFSCDYGCGQLARLANHSRHRHYPSQTNKKSSHLCHARARFCEVLDRMHLRDTLH